MDDRLIRAAVIDDEVIAGQRLKDRLTEMGYPTDFFPEGEPFLESFYSAPYDLVITDLKLPGVDGLEILHRIKAVREDTEVVVITGYGTIDSAIEAIREGAFHYLTKPIRLFEFENLISRIIEKILLRKETLSLRASLGQQAGFEGLIGASPEMNQVFRLIKKVAPLDCPVIIAGESGSGKELVAQAIHRLSPRKNGPIVSFNCGGFSPELIANELFGHEKGAFTGATSSKMGLLETANHGAVLFDEIAETPTEMQVKLLRVLQEKQFYRVGANQPTSLDIRVLAASNKDLGEEVKKGTFREDLFFRLNVVTIRLPSLKERTGDLELLLDHFLKKFNLSYGKNIKGFSKPALTALRRYYFPGNIRELENITARAAALSEGREIGLDDLPEALRPSEMNSEKDIGSLEDMEKEHIAKILRSVQGRREDAARILGVTRTTLWRKIKKYGLAED